MAIDFVKNLKKDEIIDYPSKQVTGNPAKDWLFNWVVRRYQKNNHSWKKSDQRTWSGGIYGVGNYLGALLFFAFFGFLLYQTNKLYGFERAALLAMLMILFRVNIAIKQMVQLNRKF